MSETEAARLGPEIDRAAEAILRRHPAFRAHGRFVRDRLAELAHRAYEHGMAAAWLEIQTTDEVAEALDIRPVTVRYHASQHGIGWRIGRDILFRPEDVAALRERVGRRGRPRTPDGTSDDV